MDAERAVIQPEPDGWDKKVPCFFKNLEPNAREIIHKNLIYYFKSTNFDSLVKEPGNEEYSFECTRDHAISIRDNLHLILTSSYTNVWFTINTLPLHKLQEHLLSDKKTVRHQPAKVSFSFGSLYSTKLFYNHTSEFNCAGSIKVWFERSRAASLILKMHSLNKTITIPIRYIQKTLLVNRGHENQPIQIILMLNSAVKIEENETNINSFTRIGNDEIPNSFTDIISKSSALFLQFDPPANAWPFLLSLPIVGHTDNNKRQDGNFHINFALFTMEDWPNMNAIEKPCFNSFKSQYSIEMLHSLGYIFTDKYTKSQAAQKSFIKIERDFTNEFHNVCSRIYKALKGNQCLDFDDLIRLHTPNTNTSNNMSIDMTYMDDQNVFIRHITLTPMCVIFNPLIRERSNRALRIRGTEKYIRVCIREENNENLDTLTAEIRLRFKQKMFTDGIMCMNKRYYFVGASTNQMKKFSYWFTALNDGETIDQVRTQFGDFTAIKNLATFVARVGLYFSTSFATGIRFSYINRSSNSINIPGAGSPASSSLSDWSWMQPRSWFKKSSDIPSVFQIRMAGCKGILMIDPESAHDDYYIKVRDSMVKFESDDWILHICDYSRPMPLSLNNQIIRLLSDLGNKLEIFESLQNRMSKPLVWHPPEDTYLNVFDSELINDQQLRY
ncbi:unnamed protein product [Adineta steineri]|uniref:RNA-dependent RNA polymerase n=1 Tax=Adineta steineri TaxID=433720 RepID=A0A819SQT1_9BILA|nr:unnamed protein product [Adineta steineri]CAF4065896.1 unnamed protein product [Adineta steineri]